MTAWIRSALGLALGLLFGVGCASSFGMKQLASRDLRCNASAVDVDVEWARATARGCGRVVHYRQQCTEEKVMRPTTTRTSGHSEQKCGYEYAPSASRSSGAGTGSSSQFRCRLEWIPAKVTFEQKPQAESRCDWVIVGKVSHIAEARTVSPGPSIEQTSSERIEPSPRPSATPVVDASPIVVARGAAAFDAERRLEQWLGREVAVLHRDGRVVIAPLKSLRGHALVLGADAVWPIEDVAQVELTEPPATAVPPTPDTVVEAPAPRPEAVPEPPPAPLPTVVDVASFASPWDAEASLEAWLRRDVVATHRDGRVVTAPLKSLRGHSLVLGYDVVWPIEEVARVALVSPSP